MVSEISSATLVRRQRSTAQVLTEKAHFGEQGREEIQEIIQDDKPPGKKEDSNEVKEEKETI